MRLMLALFALALAFPAQAEEALSDNGGEVRVPLSTYTAMLNQLTQDPRPAPAARPRAARSAGAPARRGRSRRSPSRRMSPRSGPSRV